MAAITGTAITTNFGMRSLVKIPRSFLGTVFAASEIVKNHMVRVTPRGETGFMKLRCKRYNLLFSEKSASVKVGWQSKDFFGKTFYPEFVEGGTGIYGPFKTRIVSNKPSARRKNGRFGGRPFLRFEGRHGWIAKKSIAGQKSKHILDKTIGLSQSSVQRLARENVVLAITKV